MAATKETKNEQVKTVEEFFKQPDEFQTAVRKIVRSHAINELYGSQVFDEPAIALAPTPYAKWLTCRVAMEEYGHHVRFAELGEAIGIPHNDLVPRPSGKKPLSVMAFKMTTWTEFCVLKLVGDLAEILQVEDLLHCTVHPLRNLARMTMPEERFHAQFGEDFCTDMIEHKKPRAEVQDAINRIFPNMPAFFGASKSKNNEIFRKWGIKLRTNDDMRADYVNRARDLVEGKLGLELPTVPIKAA
jgi:ring-1,2-phenylacetyl-CoA epoxidase subunit PaaA